MTSNDPATASQHSPDEILAFMRRHMGALANTMGIELTAATPDEVTARMPVEGNTQPYGLLHGGANAVLAETVGSIAAALNAGEGNIIFGVELSCTHHRSVREGFVIGTARPLHRGRTMSSYDITITDEAGKRLCSSRLTCAVRPNEGAAPVSGS